MACEAPSPKRVRWVSIIIPVLVLTLGILFASVGYTMYYAQAFSYLSDDPTACVNCHIMNDVYDGWQKAGHHAFATCNDCHVPHDLVGKYYTKAENGYHHSVAFTFGGFHEPIQMRQVSRQIVIDNCKTCHAQLVSEMMAMSDPDEPDDCIRCHAAAGHGPPR